MTTKPVTSAAIRMALHRDIVEGRLAPGHLMTETEIADRFGVSKTPAREALRELASTYGYVIAIARRGYQITPLTMREIHDVYDLLLRLAPSSAADAARRPFAYAVNRLDDLAVHAHVPGDRNSYIHMQTEHAGLLAMLGYSAGSAILGETLLRICDRSLRIVNVGYPALKMTEPVTHDHRDVVAAIRAGDCRQAESLVHDLIAGARDRVLDAVVDLDVSAGLSLVIPE
jgi:DNA-binding GntR family transcriptional regulator